MTSSSRPSSGTIAVVIVVSVLTVSAIGNLAAQWGRITSDPGFAIASLAGMVLAATWGVRKARQAPSS